MRGVCGLSGMTAVLLCAAAIPAAGPIVIPGQNRSADRPGPGKFFLLAGPCARHGKSATECASLNGERQQFLQNRGMSHSAAFLCAIGIAFRTK